MSKKLPKTDNIWPKWRNFRQIWSRCAMLLLCVCDSKAFEKTPLIVHGSIYRFTRILKVEQCDQMVNCLLQCLAVYNNENLWFKLLPNKPSKMQPTWQNYAKPRYTTSDRLQTFCLSDQVGFCYSFWCSKGTLCLIYAHLYYISTGLAAFGKVTTSDTRSNPNHWSFSSLLGTFLF